jgi:hypothetical protein
VKRNGIEGDEGTPPGKDRRKRRLENFELEKSENRGLSHAGEVAKLPQARQRAVVGGDLPCVASVAERMDSIGTERQQRRAHHTLGASEMENQTKKGMLVERSER